MVNLFTHEIYTESDMLIFWLSSEQVRSLTWPTRNFSLLDSASQNLQNKLSWLNIGQPFLPEMFELGSVEYGKVDPGELWSHSNATSRTFSNKFSVQSSVVKPGEFIKSKEPFKSHDRQI